MTDMFKLMKRWNSTILLNYSFMIHTLTPIPPTHTQTHAHRKIIVYLIIDQIDRDKPLIFEYLY